MTLTNQSSDESADAMYNTPFLGDERIDVLMPDGNTIEAHFMVISGAEYLALLEMHTYIAYDYIMNHVLMSADGEPASHWLDKRPWPDTVAICKTYIRGLDEKGGTI